MNIEWCDLYWVKTKKPAANKAPAGYRNLKYYSIINTYLI